MIEARAPYLDLLVWQTHDASDVTLTHENAVAQAEGADRTVFSERQDDAVLGIGKIEEQRLRAELLHLSHEVKHQRQSAERKHQTAGAAVLAKRVANAIFARHVEIDFPKAVAVDRRGIDDESGAIKCGAPVRRMLDNEPSARLVV